MKKLIILSFCIGAALLGCSKEDHEENSTQQNNDYPCRFEVVFDKAEKPQINYNNESKVIRFEIVNYEPMLLNGPNPENTCAYFDYIINTSDFRKYQSTFTSLGNLNPPTSENIYDGLMINGDKFRFDYNDAKTSGIIKCAFYCVH